MPTGSSPNDLTFEQTSRLVKLLLACPSIGDQNSRETVIRQLPPQIANAVSYAPNAIIHVTNLVQTCLHYTDGLQELVSRVQFFDQGTVALADLEQYLNELNIYPYNTHGPVNEQILLNWLRHLNQAYVGQKWPEMIRLDNDMLKSVQSLVSQIAVAYNQQGIIYDKQGLPEEAFTCFDRAIELAPDFDQAYRQRGSIHAARGNYEAALHDFDRAIGLNSLLDEAYNNRGWVYRQLLDYRESLRDFDRAIDLEPTQAGYYHNRALTHLALGDLESYQQDLKIAVSFGYPEAIRELEQLQTDINEGP